MADVSKLKIGDASYDVKDVEARKIAKERAGVTTWGKTRFVFIDKEDGDDSNHGLDEDHPIKTIAHYLDMVKGIDGISNWQLYLMGDYTYDIPSLVITAASPHFFPWNGDPTLNFSFKTDDPNATTTGPRFYSAHVALYSKKTALYGEHHLKVTNSVYHSLYFEGCSVSADKVEFLIPIRVYGGSFISTGCSFTTIKGVNTMWENILTHEMRAAAILQEATARITDATIKSDDAISTGFYIWSSSNVAIYNDLTLVNQTVEPGTTATKPVIDIRASRGYIAPVTNYSTLLSPYKQLLSANASTIHTTDLFIDELNAYGMSRANSFISVGNGFARNTGLIKGQTFNRDKVILHGYTVGSGKEIRCSVPLEYRCPVGNVAYNVSIPTKMDVRAGGVSLTAMNIKSVDVLSSNGYELILKIVTTTEGLPNYTAAGVYLENLNIKIDEPTPE